MRHSRLKKRIGLRRQEILPMKRVDEISYDADLENTFIFSMLLSECTVGASERPAAAKLRAQFFKQDGF